MPRRIFLALLCASGLLVGAARAQIIVGNSIVSRGIRDTAQTVFVMSSQGFGAGAIGSSVATWSYYSLFNGSSLTPVLFERTGVNHDYIVRAIGASVTTSLGAHLDLPFNLATGSLAITNGNFFFGWKDGTASTDKAASIAFDYNAGTPKVVYFAANGPAGFAVSNSYNFDGHELGRTYSISASTIPEPSVTAALVAVAALGCAVWRRRTKRGGASDPSPGTR